MKIDDIYALWADDCKIDKANLDTEALMGGELHHKYSKILTAEKKHLRILEAEYKVLHLDKSVFFFEGHNEVTRAKGWELPPKGALRVKTEIPAYVAADKDIIDLSLRIGMQQEKCDALKSILDKIISRQWDIKNSLEAAKLKAGMG